MLIRQPAPGMKEQERNNTNFFFFFFLKQSIQQKNERPNQHEYRY